jgi:NAD(P)-dependent dehydrogenase (short-subunit alcohol dehydrogenase family)
MMTNAMSSQTGGKMVGQRVLVTGAGRGIGRAIALWMSAEGAKVAISSRTQHELQETADACRRNHQCANHDAAGKDDGKDEDEDNVSMHVVDVTDSQQVEDMVQSIVHQWGGIDVLINNAGGAQAQKGPSETLDSNDLKHLLDLNVVSVHMVTSAVLRHAMLVSNNNGGKIVNISSRAGKVGLPQMSFYVASKFALEGLTATMAEELRDKNIQINTLSPGMVNTQSFPKPPGKPGVRSAESVADGLWTILNNPDGVTGHYLHVDELDQARARGLPDTAALKPIREPLF